MSLFIHTNKRVYVCVCVRLLGCSPLVRGDIAAVKVAAEAQPPTLGTPSATERNCTNSCHSMELKIQSDSR